MRQLDDIKVVYIRDTIDDAVDVVTVPIEQRLDIEALEVVIINFDSDGIEK